MALYFTVLYLPICFYNFAVPSPLSYFTAAQHAPASCSARVHTFLWTSPAFGRYKPIEILQMELLDKNATRTSFLPQVSMSSDNYSKENDLSGLLALTNVFPISISSFTGSSGAVWCCVLTGPDEKLQFPRCGARNQ